MRDHKSLLAWKGLLLLCSIIVAPAFAHDPSNLKVTLDNDEVSIAKCGDPAKNVKATVSFDHKPESLSNCATCRRGSIQEAGTRTVAVQDHSCAGSGVLSVALATYNCQDTVGYSQTATLKVTCEKVRENKKDRCRPHVNGVKVADEKRTTLKIFGVAGTCAPDKCRAQGQRVDTPCYPPVTGCAHSRFAQLKITCPKDP